MVFGTVFAKKMVNILTAQLNTHLKYPKMRWNHNLWIILSKIEAGPMGNGA